MKDNLNIYEIRFSIKSLLKTKTKRYDSVINNTNNPQSQLSHTQLILHTTHSRHNIHPIPNITKRTQFTDINKMIGFQINF